MGGYGALITAGGGVTEASVAFGFSPPYGALGIHQSGSDAHNSLPDARIKMEVSWTITLTGKALLIAQRKDCTLSG